MENISLSEMNEGELAKITTIHGGQGFRQRLSLNGLMEGNVVRIISSRGPITIEVNRSIVSLGRGMARKIRVVRT
ncbi:MAG: FeoA family protein [Candidatus Methanofastidiosia archaeon]